MSKKEMKSAGSFEGALNLSGFRSNTSRFGNYAKTHDSKDKPFIFRIGTMLPIAAMLLQVFFVVPIRTANASSYIPSSSRGFQLPFSLESIEKFLSGYIPDHINTTDLSDKAAESLSELKATMKLSEGKLMSLGSQFAAQTASIFGLFAPNTAAKLRGSNPQPMYTVYPNIPYDFDGDGFSDIGRWRASSTDFTFRNSSDSTFTSCSLGSSSAIAAPGDYNGDGATDAGVFDTGTFTYKVSPSSTPQTISLGVSGIPVSGDYDGDGKTDGAVYTPGSSATWKYKSPVASPSATPVTLSCVTTCGTTGDIPVPGNYDGDSDTDIAVFRPSNGNWYISYTGGGGTTFHWGQDGDIPLQGDFDGDGKSDPAVFRPGNGAWYWANSSTSYSTTNYVIWGNYADQPVPGNYYGTGRTDFAVWRPTTGAWHILENVVALDPYEVTLSDPIYEATVLGAIGDEAIESAYTKQIGSSVTGDVLGPLRLKATNATGGTNLNSQNFGWSSNLVSLPGRSGLDLNLSIGYNSLIWIKNGSTMYFDPDVSNVAPGFRLGFPVIEPVYYDSTKSKWTYMMVTPSGARVEFRQIGAGGTYETFDSSYSQLVIGLVESNPAVEDINMTVKTTDGTQMKYEWKVGAYRCTRIIDRNGNYISMTYDPTFGMLTEISDTLGRVVNINYDENNYPIDISQTWKTVNGSSSNTTHKWAEFTYTTKTVSTDWDSSITTVVGPPSTTVVKVLEKITYADDSSTKFDYNGYLQVSKVSTIGADSSSHVLNYVSTNLDSPASDRTDCPRFTETKTQAEDFNGGSAVVVNNTRTAAQSYTFPGSVSVTGALITSKVASHPNDLETWTYIGETGWKEGLTLGTRDCVTTECTGTGLVRWTWNDWETDTIGGGDPPTYMMNPRIKETRIGDGSNVKKITNTYIYTGGDDVISYFGLVDETSVGDMSTVLKAQKNTYITSSNYTNRRIIGLPEEIKLYQGAVSGGTLMSKMTYAYDEGSRASLSSATHHDTSNYGTGFVYRGNLTTTTRWDVTSPTNGSLAVSSQIVYNIAGSPITQIDPRGRETGILYTDSWNDSVSRTTYAYPTTITDSGGNSSTIKYRYDIGTNVEARSPVPYASGTANTQGKITSRYFDSAGRISLESIGNNGAYTSYWYDTNGKEVITSTTLVDVDGDDPDAGDEVQTLTVTDGAGRMIKTRTENPEGGYIGKKIIYDILGRPIEESVPTQINSSWTPSGDDSGSWKMNKTGYDWKGRPTITIPSDSTSTIDGITLDGRETIISYNGCGCSGGQETTIIGPQIIGYNAAGALETTAKRPKKMIYEDSLGRTYKTELFDFYENSPTAAYRTTITTFNGRDQITNIAEYAGTTSGTHQDTEMTYDGHGRLSMLHKPEWYGTSATSDKKYTTATYNADDTMATVTDPRGAITTYTYENDGSSLKRPLVTGIAYATPSPNPTPPSTLHVPDASTVTFTYDYAGNRTSMADGTGTLYYSYDELSRLTSERKVFADSFEKGLEEGYTLTYEYYLAGGLKSIEDPFHHKTTYAADKVGRMTAIGAAGTGDPVTGSTVFASSIQYRAFGAVKSMSIGTSNATTIAMSYDDALRPLTYTADNSTTGSGWVQKASYSYDKAGSVKTITNTAHTDFNQTNEYDFAGRLKENNVGSGSTFAQTMDYDAFSNMTRRDTQTYSLGQIGFTASYSNNRKSGDTYDVAGNVIASTTSGQSLTGGGGWYADNKYWYYDAAGRMERWEEEGPYGANTKRGGETTYDGDGRPAKQAELQKDRVGGVWGDWNAFNWYHLYSSVTGQKITDLTLDGSYAGHSVYMGGTILWDNTYQGPYQNSNNAYSAIGFKVTDPISGSTQEMIDDGTVPTQTADPNARNELAGLGTSIPATDPTSAYEPNYHRHGYAGNSGSGCQINYGPVSCSTMKGYLRAWGLAFAGDHIVTETWHLRYVFAHPPGVNGQTRSWAQETWLRTEREFRGYGIMSFSSLGAFFGNVPQLWGGTLDERARFKAAWLEAQKRLESEACKKAIGGDSAQKLLSSVKYQAQDIAGELDKDRKKDKQPLDSSSYLSYKELKYMNVSLGGKALFFDKTNSFLSDKTSYPQFESKSLDMFKKPTTNAELGAYTILEGIGAIAGSGIHGPGSAERGLDSRVANAQIILKACFGEIPKLEPLPDEP